MPRNQIIKKQSGNTGENSNDAIMIDTDNEAEENESELPINNENKNEDSANENGNGNGNNEEKDENNDNESEEEDGNENENENENENKNDKNVKKSKDAPKRRKKKTDNQYRVYIYKILQQVHPKLGITKTAMDIVNCFIQDYFEKICNEAMKLNQFHKSNTVSVREIETACKLLLPGELKKHALLEGDQAVKKFSENKKQLQERRKELRGGQPGVFRGGKRKSKTKN